MIIITAIMLLIIGVTATTIQQASAYGGYGPFFGSYGSGLYGGYYPHHHHGHCVTTIISGPNGGTISKKVCSF